MQDEYDVVVLGGGSAGENVAGRVSAGGLSAVVVESELVGGECSYWACMPSKALLRPAEVLAAARRVPGARSAVTGVVDAQEALKRRDAAASNYDDAGQVQWLESVNVDLIRGRGRLTGERCVEVEASDGSRRTLNARVAVVLATGSTAAMPPIDGLQDVAPWDSRTATAAKEVPQSLLVLGGGPVGVEMAQAWRTLGAEEVTVVVSGDRLIPREEPFASSLVADAFDKLGIRIYTGTTMVKVRRNGRVTATLEDGTDLSAQELLVAVGRRPGTVDVGVETVGLEPGRPVRVDDQLRAVDVPGGWLYAVGDVNGRNPLTHMGKYQARLAGDAILGRDVAAWADNAGAPRVVFTDPQVAAVGLTEQQARDRGLRVRTVAHPFGASGGAVTTGQGVRGNCQIVIDEDRRVIVGATFVGPGAGEMLHAATIAIVGGVTLDQLWHAVPAFPTISEFWLRFLEVYGL